VLPSDISFIHAQSNRFPQTLSPFHRMKRTLARQQVGYEVDLGTGILSHRVQIAPHRRRPTRIAVAPTDNVQMELRHDIADAGKIYFVIAERGFYETGQHRGLIDR